MADKPYIVDGVRASRDAYNKSKFNRFLVTVPKGEQAKIVEYANKHGYKSLNVYITSLIAADMKKEED